MKFRYIPKPGSLFAAGCRSRYNSGCIRICKRGRSIPQRCNCIRQGRRRECRGWDKVCSYRTRWLFPKGRSLRWYRRPWNRSLRSRRRDWVLSYNVSVRHSRGNFPRPGRSPRGRKCNRNLCRGYIRRRRICCRRLHRRRNKDFRKWCIRQDRCIRRRWSCHRGRGLLAFHRGGRRFECSPPDGSVLHHPNHNHHRFRGLRGCCVRCHRHRR